MLDCEISGLKNNNMQIPGTKYDDKEIRGVHAA